MNGVHLAHITRINRRTNGPRLVFSADWMACMGFLPGALVQYLPQPGGMTFVLCDENITRYSELFRVTKDMGGTLMQVYRYRDGLQLCVSGAVLDCTGLVYGDNLIARYEYGLIRIRKLPGGTVKGVTSRLMGQWLDDLGFMPDSVLTVASVPGIITCQLCVNGAERTSELVRHARANRLKLLQVQKAKHHMPVIELPATCLQKAGFTPDETLLATYEHGKIQLQRPDFVGLGF